MASIRPISARLVVSSALVWLGLGAADASAVSVFFQSPARNIHCAYFSGGPGPAQVRCDTDFRTRFVRPARCDLDFGQAFVITATGRGHAICHGDTTKLPSARVVRVGITHRHGALACRAPTATSMRCTNTGRHGFYLSPRRQLVF